MDLDSAVAAVYQRLHRMGGPMEARMWQSRQETVSLCFSLIWFHQQGPEHGAPIPDRNQGWAAEKDADTEPFGRRSPTMRQALVCGDTLDSWGAVITVTW